MIGNTGIEWSNPQVWASVAPLVQQYAKGYNDRADSNLKLKLSLQQAKDKAAQAQALEQLKMQQKQQVRTDAEMQKYNRDLGDLFPEDAKILGKGYDERDVRAGKYKLKTGKNPYDIANMDEEAMQLREDNNLLELQKDRLKGIRKGYTDLDLTSIDPEQEDQVAQSRLEYMQKHKPDMTWRDLQNIDHQWGYKRTPELEAYSPFDYQKVATAAGQNIRDISNKENKTGYLLEGTHTKELILPKVEESIKAAISTPEGIAKHATNPNFAVTDESGNPIPQVDENGRQIVKKYKGKDIPLWEVDIEKVKDFTMNLVPNPEFKATEKIASKPANTNVTVNMPDSGVGVDANAQIAEVKLDQQKGMVQKLFGDIPLVGDILNKDISSKNSSVAQTRFTHEGNFRVSNNDVVILPGKGNIPLAIQRLDNGAYRKISQKEYEKALKDKDIGFGEGNAWRPKSEVYYLPVDAEGNIVENTGGKFSYAADDKRVVGAAGFIQIDNGKGKEGEPEGVFLIPVAAIDPNQSKFIPKPILDEYYMVKGVGVNQVKPLNSKLK